MRAAHEQTVPERETGHAGPVCPDGAATIASGRRPPIVTTLADLTARVTAGLLGPHPAAARVSVAFVTRQGVRHDGRARGYRNHVVSLRLDAAVGSCAVEPDEVPDDEIFDCVGRSIAELLTHPVAAVRLAALDAYLLHTHPHEAAAATGAAEVVTVPAGSSLAKSRARSAAVVELLPLLPGGRVLVVGVVNSLLHQLRSCGMTYLPCDLRPGRTEWGEPHVADALSALDDCDALLVSGMTLGNGTFEPLAAHARDTGKPLVAFAQTGSGVLPWFLGAGVSAVSAEPYPFFWLDGGPTVIHRYRAAS
jgi:hypothetical protein